MKKIFHVILLIILLSSFYLLYNKQVRINKDIINIKQDLQDISDKLNHSSDYSYMKEIGEIKKYGGEVLQIGGIGSRFNQPTAYMLTEHGYLKPSEEWILVSFNSPADLMDVSCKEGYTLTSCLSNGKPGIIEDVMGCRTLLEDKMKNVVYIECNKN